MEPLNGVIEIKGDGTAEIWAGAQFQTVEQAPSRPILGLKPEQVKINTVWAGGSFGRRADAERRLLRRDGDDRQGDRRQGAGPAGVDARGRHQGRALPPDGLSPLRAALDAAGNIAGWDQTIVGQSFIIGSPFEAMIVKDGIDATVVEGAADMPYRVAEPGGRLAPRSSSPVHDAVVAFGRPYPHGAGRGGHDRRRWRMRPARTRSRSGSACCSEHPRHAARSQARGRERRLGREAAARAVAAASRCTRASAASSRMTADVTVAKDGSIKVDRVVAAVDCGVAVNPDVIRAQVESGVGYGLGAALRNQITLTGRRRRPVQLRRLRAAADLRHAEGRGAHRAVAASRRPASASRACRRSRRRSSTRSSRRPASGSIRCRGTSRC